MAKEAKEIIHEPSTSSTTMVLKMKDNQKPPTNLRGPREPTNSTPELTGNVFPICKTNLASTDNRFINSTSNFCQKKGHKSMYLMRKRGEKRNPL